MVEFIGVGDLVYEISEGILVIWNDFQVVACLVRSNARANSTFKFDRV